MPNLIELDKYKSRIFTKKKLFSILRNVNELNLFNESKKIIDYCWYMKNHRMA